MRDLYRYAIVLATVAIALTAMLIGLTYSVPDLLRVDYGFPLRWGSNILDTIAGPVNKWGVDLFGLTADLVFWFAVVVAVTLYLMRRK